MDYTITNQGPLLVNPENGFTFILKRENDGFKLTHQLTFAGQVFPPQPMGKFATLAEAHASVETFKQQRWAKNYINEFFICEGDWTS